MAKWIVADDFNRTGPLDASRASYSSGLGSTAFKDLFNQVPDGLLFPDQWVASGDGLYTSGGRLKSFPDASGTTGFMPFVSLLIYKKSFLKYIANSFSGGNPPNEDQLRDLLTIQSNSIIKNDDTACMFTDFQHNPFTENNQGLQVNAGFWFSSFPLVFYADGDIQVPMVDALDTIPQLSTNGLVICFSQDFFRTYRSTDFVSNYCCIRFHATYFYYISNSPELPLSLSGYGLYFAGQVIETFPDHYIWVGIRQFIAGFDDPNYSVVGQSNYRGRLEFIGPHTGASSVATSNISVGPFFSEEDLPMGPNKVYVEAREGTFMRPGFASKTMAFNESVMDLSGINVPSTPASNLKFRKTLVAPTPAVQFQNPGSHFVVSPPVEVSFDDMLAYGVSGGSGGWNTGSVSAGSAAGGASFLGMMIITLVLVDILGFK